MLVTLRHFGDVTIGRGRELDFSSTHVVKKRRESEREKREREREREQERELGTEVGEKIAKKARTKITRNSTLALLTHYRVNSIYYKRIYHNRLIYLKKKKYIYIYIYIVMYAAEFVHAIHVQCMYTSPNKYRRAQGHS